MKPPRHNTPIFIINSDYEFCNIYRATKGISDTFGDQEDIIVTTANVKCILQPTQYLSGNILRMFDLALVAISTHLLIVSVATNIKSKDRIQDYCGNSYDVISVNNWHTHKTAMLKVID